MKGITPIIAVILLLLITIGIVGFAFVFFQQIFTKSTQGAETILGSTTIALASDFVIDNVDFASSVVTLRNIGSATISGFAVYVDGAPAAYNALPIGPGSVGDVLLSAPLTQGTHSIKITAGAHERTTSVTVGSAWVFSDLVTTGAP